MKKCNSTLPPKRVNPRTTLHISIPCFCPAPKVVNQRTIPYTLFTLPPNIKSKNAFLSSPVVRRCIRAPTAFSRRICLRRPRARLPLPPPRPLPVTQHSRQRLRSSSPTTPEASTSRHPQSPTLPPTRHSQLLQVCL